MPTHDSDWIVGGILALALILGILVKVGRDIHPKTVDKANRPAAAATTSPAAAPATTGSAEPTPPIGR
jgi:hypothetical protein